MFELPNEDSMRETAPYIDIFMFTLFYNIGIYGIFALALFLFFLIIKLYQLRKKKFESLQKRDSLLTYDENNRESVSVGRISQSPEERNNHIQIEDSPNMTQQQSQENNLNNRQKRITLFNVINFFTSFFFYLVLMALAFLYLNIYIFGLMGRGTSHDIVAVVIMFAIVFLPTLIWKVKTRNSENKSMRREVIVTIVLLVLWIGVSITSVLLLKGVCVCVFNENYGVKIQGDFVFSTQFTRSQQIEPVCPSKSLCHLYATLTEQTSTSVIMNAHTALDIVSLNITLSSGNQSFSVIQNSTISLTNVEYIAQRNVYSFYFDGLTPNTTYNVTVIDYDTKKTLNETTYLTLPNRQADQIRFAVGGDVGMNNDAIKLTSYLIDYNPHVILLGGDIAYDDGMDTCFYSWDNFYRIFQTLNIKLNRLVPMVLTVGNHDVGFDALASVQKQYTSLQNTPYFFVFNPQEVRNGKIPLFNQRFSYHLHKIGPTVHVHLDSGYVESYSSQVFFVKFVNTQFNNFYKFANYHNPLYPSCTVNETNSNDMNVISNGTEFWTPHFDNGSFKAIFEHHTHHRKFTKKIRGDKPVDDETSEGVRYVGDGSWGVPEGGCGTKRQTKRPEYFEYMDHGEPNHIWLLTLKKKGASSHQMNYTAIDINNQIVYNKTDSMTLNS